MAISPSFYSSTPIHLQLSEQETKQLHRKIHRAFVKRGTDLQFITQAPWYKQAICLACVSAPTAATFNLSIHAFNFLGQPWSKILGVSCWVVSSFSFGTFIVVSTVRALDQWEKISSTKKIRDLFKYATAFLLGMVGEVPFAFVTFKYSGLGAVGAWVQLPLGSVPNIPSWMVFLHAPKERFLKPCVSNFRNLLPRKLSCLPSPSEQEMIWTRAKAEFAGLLELRLGRLRQENSEFLSNLWKNVNRNRNQPQQWDELFRHYILQIIQSSDVENFFAAPVFTSEWIATFIWKALFLLFALNSAEYSILNANGGVKTVLRYFFCNTTLPEFSTAINITEKNHLFNQTRAYLDFSCEEWIEKIWVQVCCLALAFTCTLSNNFFRFQYAWQSGLHVLKQFFLFFRKDPAINRWNQTLKQRERCLAGCSSFLLAASVLPQFAIVRWENQRNFPFSLRMASMIYGAVFSCFLGSILLRRMLLDAIEACHGTLGSAEEQSRIAAEQVADSFIQAFYGLSTAEFRAIFISLDLPMNYWDHLAQQLPAHLRETFKQERAQLVSMLSIQHLENLSEEERGMGNLSRGVHL